MRDDRTRGGIEQTDDEKQTSEVVGGSGGGAIRME